MSSLGLCFAGFPSAGRPYLAQGFDDREALAAEAALAKLVLRLRLRRKRQLGIEGMADPAWDMLLDLFASTVDGRPVSKSSLVASVELAQSTGLRWLNDLIEAGVMHPYPDPDDGRRVFVAMDEEMFRRMHGFLCGARSEAEAFASRVRSSTGP